MWGRSGSAAVGDGDGDGVGDRVGEGELDGDADGVADGDGELLGEADGEGETDGDGVAGGADETATPMPPKVVSAAANCWVVTVRNLPFQTSTTVIVPRLALNPITVTACSLVV